VKFLLEVCVDDFTRLVQSSALFSIQPPVSNAHAQNIAAAKRNEA
jgi:hypothetical protein